MYDVAILGGGPAGYTAGIYAARYGLDTVLIEQGIAGGQISTTDIVDNFPGIPHVNGAELGSLFESQAIDLGLHALNDTVSKLSMRGDGSFLIETDSGAIEARSVITALGASPRLGDFAGEEDFRGRGVSYCATCDGMFFRNKRVYVVGGGTSACEEALYLSNIASEVVMLVRRDVFRAEKGIVEKVLSRENITVRYQTVIKALTGSALPEVIELQSTADGATETIEHAAGSFGVFVFAGTVPNTELVKDLVELDASGAVVTDERMQTSTAGLFAAGDMRNTVLRQVVTACADGAIAASSAYKFLN